MSKTENKHKKKKNPLSPGSFLNHFSKNSWVKKDIKAKSAESILKKPNYDQSINTRTQHIARTVFREKFTSLNYFY